MSLQGSILVPLDGSDVAERAVPVAAYLARRSGSTCAWYTSTSRSRRRPSMSRVCP